MLKLVMHVVTSVVKGSSFENYVKIKCKMRCVEVVVSKHFYYGHLVFG
jgi:hypothetical protein